MKMSRLYSYLKMLSWNLLRYVRGYMRVYIYIYEEDISTLSRLLRELVETSIGLMELVSDFTSWVLYHPSPGPCCDKVTRATRKLSLPPGLSSPIAALVIVLCMQDVTLLIGKKCWHREWPGISLQWNHDKKKTARFERCGFKDKGS